jgi:hypothetical protein
MTRNRKKEEWKERGKEMEKQINRGEKNERECEGKKEECR